LTQTLRPLALTTAQQAVVQAFLDVEQRTKKTWTYFSEPAAAAAAAANIWPQTKKGRLSPP